MTNTQVVSVLEQLTANVKSMAETMAQVIAAQGMAPAAPVHETAAPVAPAPIQQAQAIPVQPAQPVARYADDPITTAAVRRLNIPCANAVFCDHARFGTGLAYFVRGQEFPGYEKPFARALELWRTAFGNPGMVIHRDGRGISLFIPGITPAHIGL